MQGNIQIKISCFIVNRHNCNSSGNSKKQMKYW